MKCENAHGLYGGYIATIQCEGVASHRVTAHEDGVKLIEEICLCNNCIIHLRNLMDMRTELYNREIEITTEKIQ